MTALSISMPAPLPALRSELRLQPGPKLGSGEASWLIFDPVKHSYFRIGAAAMRLLRYWAPTEPEAVLARANAEPGEPLTEDDIEQLRRFVIANRLSVAPPEGDYIALASQEEMANPPLWRQLLHKIIFTRVPLVRPDGFLRATYPLAAPFFSRWVWLVIAVTAVFALYLVSRQWDVFVTTFLHFLTLEGLLFYGITLVGIMSLHELGHGYAARRYGVHVSTIGVAFIVFLPILYTDVTDAWRLTDRRKRLVIDIAGVAVELIIATLATLLWVFLPDGPLRSAAFFAATTSWILSVAINLNPFMRFDGYYVLSDLIGMPNLHARSFAFGRWRLREILFGLGAPMPEPLLRWQTASLTLFAWATWIYRFFLFLGIALLVHAMFAKAIGILLFLVEIFFFIARPILNEMKQWVEMRAQIIKARRWLVTAGCLGVALILLLLPWRGAVHAPAIAEPHLITDIHPPAKGQLVSTHVEEGEWVEAGTVLYRLKLPTIDHELKMTEIEQALLRDKLDRRVEDRVDRDQTMVLLQALVSNEERAAGLQRLKSNAVIRAPHAGHLLDVPRDLAPGEWLDTSVRLARLADTRRFEFTALASETEMRRVHPGAAVTFISDDVLVSKLGGDTQLIATASLPVLTDREFAQPLGGPIAVRETKDGELVPQTAMFEIRGGLDGAQMPLRAITGIAVIEADRESPAKAIWRRVSGVLLREADF